MDKNGKILIVDDSKFNREILSEILNQYTVIEVKNGYEALEYMKADKNIALVLLDLVMPEMDGFEVLKYMNQNHLIDEIAVMIISINKDDQSIEKAYELGISGYITRPFSSAVVLKKVNNIISHYKRQKKLTTIINKQIYEKYKNNDMMIMILSHIVESRNGESGLHVLHIKKLTKLLLNILVKKTNQYSLTLDDMISIEVASSLHDIGKIVRLEEMGVEPYMVANSLVGVVAQRLMRKVCPYCKKEVATSLSDRLALQEGIKYISKGTGCPHCNQTGYKGRIAIHEVIEIDSKVRKMISNQEEIDDIMKYLVEEQGVETLRDQALKLVKEGKTTVDEFNKIIAYID